MRLAMWSGPRNLSTAMMYAFSARSDFAVWDEPFYAAYLSATGAMHPMREEIIAAHETDSARIAENCAGPIPTGKPNYYLKLMPHHMVDGFPMQWAASFEHVHLIRHPARVVFSYVAKREAPTLDDIGFRQQVEVYERVGGLVVDSSDIRDNPSHMLRLLCKRIGLEFDSNMLKWPSGGHTHDGVWAKHWYSAVHASTGFAGPEGELPVLPDNYAELARTAMSYYEILAARRLMP